jgi:hypothetical protein
MGRATKKAGKERSAVRAARTTRSGRATRRAKPAHPVLLTRSEVVRAVIELANTLAPADVGDLLVAESAIRERATPSSSSR